MKIAAKIGNCSYLVSMTEDEIANVAGYRYPMQMPDEMRENRDRRADLRLGTELKVDKAFVQNRAMFEQEKKVRDAAGMLRTLADMMEAAGPSEIIPTDADEGAA